jgi:hypothetical protein
MEREGDGGWKRGGWEKEGNELLWHLGTPAYIYNNLYIYIQEFLYIAHLFTQAQERTLHTCQHTTRTLVRRKK